MSAFSVRVLALVAVFILNFTLFSGASTQTRDSIVVTTGVVAAAGSEGAATDEAMVRRLEEAGYTVVSRETTVQAVRTTSQPQEEPAAVRRAALFVSNRAGGEYDSRLPALEDYLASRLSDAGFSVISHEVALGALSALIRAGGQGGEPSLDAFLENRTSALALSRNLGADSLLVATLASFGQRQRSVNAYGVSMENVDSTLRLTYRLIDGATGGTLGGDTVAVRHSAQGSKHTSETDTAVFDDLLDEAARLVVQQLRDRVQQGRLLEAAAEAALVSLTIQCETADLFVPDVRLGADNTVFLGDKPLQVRPLQVSVEIDGVVVGSAPGSFQAARGLHKIRLSREGFKDWERTINIFDGQVLNVALQLSESGYARWKDATGFLNGLVNGARLTDAEVSRLEGEARMLSASGFKVEVQTTEGITIEKKEQSIFR